MIFSDLTELLTNKYCFHDVYSSIIGLFGYFFFVETNMILDFFTPGNPDIVVLFYHTLSNKINRNLGLSLNVEF
jgi:hypothetical protein